MALTGCASNFKLHPQVAQDQSKILDDGQEVLISQKRNSVMVWPKNHSETSSEKLGIMVVVRNNGTQPILLKTSDVKATFNGQQIATCTAEQVLADIERRQRLAAALSAFGGAMSASSAASSGRYYESGSFSGTSAYGQRFSGNYTASGYNPAQAQAAVNAANAQTASNLANIDAMANHQRRRIQGKSLRDHTVRPGEIYGGAIYLDSISPNGDNDNNLVITVELNKEIHTFKMKAQKTE